MTLFIYQIYYLPTYSIINLSSFSQYNTNLSCSFWACVSINQQCYLSISIYDVNAFRLLSELFWISFVETVTDALTLLGDLFLFFRRREGSTRLFGCLFVFWDSTLPTHSRDHLSLHGLQFGKVLFGAVIESPYCRWRYWLWYVIVDKFTTPIGKISTGKLYCAIAIVFFSFFFPSNN